MVELLGGSLEETGSADGVCGVGNPGSEKEGAGEYLALPWGGEGGGRQIVRGQRTQL